MVKSRNLHATWGTIPASLKIANLDRLLLYAKAVPAINGPVDDMPVRWADDTLIAAKKAFSGVKFPSKHNSKWETSLPDGYSSKMNRIKKTQLVKAGAHLAQLLEKSGPDSSQFPFYLTPVLF